MMLSLRNRLLASYLILLLVSLVVLTVVLLVSLSSRPAPPQLSWQRLEVMIPSLANMGIVRNLGNLQGGATDFLDEFAATNDVRVMLVRVDNNREMMVVHDSLNAFAPQDTIRVQQVEYEASRVRTVARNSEIVFGAFENEDDSQWLFSGLYWQLDRPIARTNGLMLMISEERPSESLQSILVEFGSAFAAPLLQAGLVGGVVALVMAFWISRSIARPLQALSVAAQSVAQGHYDEKVPESGPREVRDVAMAFNQMSAEVRATQQSQRDFMANVSHDLKTPLTSIQGYSQAIMDGAAKNPENAARIIHDEAERLNRMVTELTDLARLQAGRLSMKITAINVTDMVEAIGQRLAVVADKKNQALNVHAQSVPLIGGDGDRLVQVFTNIISNAIKYTPANGQIDVSVGIFNGGVEVTVKDNGIGISSDDLARIFERFYQVDKSRGPSRGTGLGLAITKEIVEAHGGRIELDSDGLNRGTTVTVWLPSPQLSTVVSRKVMG